MKCKTMIKVFVTLLIAVIAILIIVLAFNIITYNKIRSAVEGRDYETVERICAIPIKNINGSYISDFFDAVFDRTPQNTPLEQACVNRDLRAAEILLHHGSNPNRCHLFKPQKEYVLDIAVAGGDMAMAKLIIDYGGKTNDGVQALSCYLYNWANSSLKSNHDIQGFDEMYQLLEDNRLIDNDRKDNAMFAAIRAGNMEAAHYLAEKRGSSWNCVDNEGSTLLHICCKTNYYKEPDKIKIADFLIKQGVDISSLDNNGKSAYDYAVKYGYNDLADLID